MRRNTPPVAPTNHGRVNGASVQPPSVEASKSSVLSRLDIGRMFSTLPRGQVRRVATHNAERRHTMKTASPRAATSHLPLGAALLLSAFALLAPVTAEAHCDTLDGPVVNTARTALETKKVEPVIAWVQPAHEAEIRHAFHKALADRQRAPESREKSDRAFFETLVRVHREGEGAPYTG